MEELEFKKKMEKVLAKVEEKETGGFTCWSIDYVFGRGDFSRSTKASRDYTEIFNPNNGNNVWFNSNIKVVRHSDKDMKSIRTAAIVMFEDIALMDKLYLKY